MNATAQPVRPGRDPNVHGALRSRGGTALLVTLAMVTGLAPLVPAIAAALRVHWTQSMAVSLITMGLHLGAYALFHRFGREFIGYRLVDWMETLAIAAGNLWLVYVSDSAVSYYWFHYLGLVFQTASTGSYRRYNGLVFAGSAGALALAFHWDGDTGSAAISLATGAIGTVVYFFLSRASADLAASMAAQRQLQAQLNELLLREERTRIARDLHDGLAADLTGLLWRARELQLQLADDPAVGEDINAFIERMEQGVVELRSIVWALRIEDQPWDQVLASIRARCQELCGSAVSFELVDEGAPPGLIVNGTLRMHLLRSVQEAARNAVRHSQARHLRITVRVDDAVHVHIVDDGVGLPPGAAERPTGGLRNLAQRMDALGGVLRIDSDATGTRIKLGAPLQTPV